MTLEMGHDFVGTESHNGVVGIEAVIRRLASHGVTVGRERRVLDDDLRALTARAVERHHQQVEVDGERVHRHHFRRSGPDEAGQRLGEQFVVRQPRTISLEVPLDGEALPGGQLGVQLVTGRLGLQTE